MLAIPLKSRYTIRVMKHTITKPSKTTAKLEVAAEPSELESHKNFAVKKLAKNVKVAGFRPGKTPPEIAEKNIDPAALQQEVLEMAVQELYIKAMMESGLQPLDRPQINITKFVPFTTLEFSAEVEIVPEIKLADYKKIKKEAPKVKVTAKEIDEVIERIRGQLTDKKEVDRPAKLDDEVAIDFDGKDDKGTPVAGASGKDYPLRLGSKSFIDGFEDNLVGMKAGDQKEFTLTFPKDYGHAPLANKDVTFSVTVRAVRELTLPEVNDEFAAKAGPFTTVAELKDDIKTELTRQGEQNKRNELKNEVLEEIADKSDIPLPQILVSDQEKAVRQDVTQNLSYRGQSLEDYLKGEKLTEEEWMKKEVTPTAEKRVKNGLILSEIAKQESIEATDDDIDQKVNELKQQFPDPRMQAQLDLPEARRDIASRLVTEMTLERLLDIVTGKQK